MVTLLHYENDNYFVIKLLPENAKHEIILYKTKIPNSLILSDFRNEAKTKIDTGIQDKGNALRTWRYQFEE